MVSETAKMFKLDADELEMYFKYFYIDEDGDSVTVTTQADLDEAYKAMPQGKVRLVLAQTLEEANKSQIDNCESKSVVFEFKQPLIEQEEVALTERQEIKNPLNAKSDDLLDNFFSDISEQLKLADEKAKMAKLPDCFRCDGSKLNKKGEACKKCKGTGKLSSKYYQDLHMLVKKEVKSICEKDKQKVFLSELNQMRQTQAKVEHEGYTCCECEASPIIGVRYKCTKRQDFNICENCEATLGPKSEFSYIKIRQASMAPLSLMCQYGDNDMTVELDLQPMENKQPPVLKEKKVEVEEDMDKSDFDVFASAIVEDKPKSVETKTQKAKEVKPSPALAQSVLKESTFDKISFVEKLDTTGQYKVNMQKLLDFGFSDFDCCLLALKNSKNNLEMALHQLVGNGGQEE